MLFRSKSREEAAYGQSLAYLRAGLANDAAVAATKAPMNHQRAAELQVAILADRALSAFTAKRYHEALLSYFRAMSLDREFASAVKNALAAQLREHFPNQPTAIGSINSPMQCMMKEICAQCLQRHVDPETKAESFVFSCFNQDQLLQEVDFANLNTRLRQNSAAEKLTSLWIDHLFSARLVQTV